NGAAVTYARYRSIYSHQSRRQQCSGSECSPSLTPRLQSQQRLSHRGPAPPEGRVLQLHIRHHHLPGAGGLTGCGGLHQRPRTRRDPGSARIRPTLLPAFCKWIDEL
ncbi:hypothetical protein GDO78_020071, partial [Eleutherodactylus coqui]